MDNTDKRKKHGPTLDDVGYTSGSTHAKDLHGEQEDRGAATLQDIERVERELPPRKDRELGTPDAEPET